LLNNNIITIPPGDINRAALFTDPLYGVYKSIFISNNDNSDNSDNFVDYVEAGGWGACYNNFFEVWKKK
jgi:hypothetical protein